MQVLAVEHKTVLGGGQLALLNIAREWQRTHAPLTVQIVCPPDAAMASRARALPLDVVTFPLGAIDKQRGTVWNLAQRVSPTFRLVQTMRRADSDVMLANGAYSFLAGVGASKLAGVPSIWFEHNTTLPQGKMVRRMIGWADSIVVVCEAIRKQFLELVPQAESKLALIYNGVDAETFRANGAVRAEMRNALGIAQDARVVGVVSRLSPEKGVTDFVAAAAELAAHAPDVEFLVVGDGSERAQLESQARKVGLGHRCKFAGFQVEVAPYLAAMDVALFPFLAEAFPLAVLEAMAAGLPVVATDVGGVREQVVDGETGIIVAPRDVPAMARATIELLDNELNRRALGECGRTRVLQRFTLAQQARAMRDVVERAAQRKFSQTVG